MASFRTGFKIFRDISLKQGLGRIRSFSEDRKAGQWQPEDQWAVRRPGSTCPEPCDKPRKPAKSSKSWLSICKDPDPPKEPECDIRHNNCPPPRQHKDNTPWYSLDNLISKKKPQGGPPPFTRCRKELKRQQEEDEEVCDFLQDSTEVKPASECIMPKRERSPAPIVSLLAPLPKELDLSLWCNRSKKPSQKIPQMCQSDRLPFQEFRPKKIWKPPPFSLPIRGDPCYKASYHSADSTALSEFKQVEVPKPLYTRYKTVDLSGDSLTFSMASVKCPDDHEGKSSQSAVPIPASCGPQESDGIPEDCKSTETTEKPVLEAASRRPVRIKRATTFKFRPKPTKLVERRVYKTVCAKHKTSDSRRPEKEEKKTPPAKPTKRDCESPKVITGTLTDEPQVLERTFDKLPCPPPQWMYQLCKPGCERTPLLPCKQERVKEPDWCSETDGLKFYDGADDPISPKPPKDPWPEVAEKEKRKAPCCREPEPVSSTGATESGHHKTRFVLMPEKYKIKFTRSQESCVEGKVSGESSFEKFLGTKAAPNLCSPQMKENIYYDLQRSALPAQLDPTQIACRKPPQPECRQPPSLYRRFSTLSVTQRNPRPLDSFKVPHRTECEDTRGKCKPRKLVPKPKECPKVPPKHPSCAALRLPCCPPHKHPPTCQTKEVKHVCKKIPPPKPSFSECARDLPPCPKMTECDCWDKISEKKEKNK